MIVTMRNDGPSLMVMPGKGIDGLADAARQARPDLDVRVGRMSWFQERMPGPSAWRPDE